MPLHHPRLLAALALVSHPTHRHHVVQARCFSASRVFRSDGPRHDQNHYEALNVSPDASHAEIKKSFYALSKTHHPDHNPSDPSAGPRFVRISEAYAVLGRADRRAAYDRDVMPSHRRHAPSPPSPRDAPSGPAGGRPASGLSRRRGTFRGPPPSFSGSGGWGAHAAKRQAAHDESVGGGAGDGRCGGSSRGAAAAEGGDGPTVSHFDAQAHERTGRWVDERMMARRRAYSHGGAPLESDDMDHVAAFIVVSSVLAVGLVLSVVVLDALTSPKVENNREETGLDMVRLSSDRRRP